MSVNNIINYYYNMEQIKEIYKRNELNENMLELILIKLINFLNENFFYVINKKIKFYMFYFDSLKINILNMENY